MIPTSGNFFFYFTLRKWNGIFTMIRSPCNIQPWKKMNPIHLFLSYPASQNSDEGICICPVFLYRKLPEQAAYLWSQGCSRNKYGMTPDLPSSYILHLHSCNQLHGSSYKKQTHKPPGYQAPNDLSITEPQHYALGEMFLLPQLRPQSCGVNGRDFSLLLCCFVFVVAVADAVDAVLMMFLWVLTSHYTSGPRMYLTSAHV